MKIHISRKALGPWLLFIILVSLFQEILLGLYIGGISLWYLPFILIINLLVFAITLFIKKDYRKWFMDGYFFLTTFIFISEFLYYRFFKTFYDFRMLGMARQLGQFLLDGLKLIIFNLPALVLFLLPVIFYCYVMRARLEELEFKSFTPIILILLSAVVFSLDHLILLALPDKPASAKEFYLYGGPQLESAKRFGLMGSLGIELAHRNFGVRLPDIEEDQHLVELEEVIEIQQSQAGVDEDSTKKLVIRPQVLDIDFLELAKTRENEALESLDLYFASSYPSMTNDYTGLFEGYNLIFITAESFWWPVVDKERTPTLYKLIHEGIYMENYYNPLWTASTSDGEYSGISGMLPKSGTWSLLRAAENYSPQLPGWRFREAGYRTYAYHNHDYSYYDRHISHPGMGYDYKGLGSGMEVKSQWPESDLEMMELSIDEYIDEEPFHVYYLTVSGHSGYSFSGNAMAAKNRDVVEDLELSEEARAYLAANMELEYALSYLMEKLEERGLAERTVIALNPDHYPYALSDEALEELAGENNSKMELYRSRGIIYVKGMEPVTITKPVCGQDLLPSLYNLMGIDFDSRLLMGRDIFSKEALVRFYDRSWITDKGYYDSESGLFTATRPVDEDYEDRIHNRVRNDFYFSGLLLDEDYYSHLPSEAFKMR